MTSNNIRLIPRETETGDKNLPNMNDVAQQSTAECHLNSKTDSENMTLDKQTQDSKTNRVSTIGNDKKLKINKNAVPRKSKSALNLTKMKKERMLHSESYSGNSLLNASSQTVFHENTCESENGASHLTNASYVSESKDHCHLVKNCNCMTEVFANPQNIKEGAVHTQHFSQDRKQDELRQADEQENLVRQQLLQQNQNSSDHLQREQLPYCQHNESSSSQQCQHQSLKQNDLLNPFRNLEVSQTNLLSQQQQVHTTQQQQRQEEQTNLQDQQLQQQQQIEQPQQIQKYQQQVPKQRQRELQLNLRQDFNNKSEWSFSKFQSLSPTSPIKCSYSQWLERNWQKSRETFLAKGLVMIELSELNDIETNCSVDAYPGDMEASGSNETHQGRSYLEEATTHTQQSPSLASLSDAADIHQLLDTDADQGVPTSYPQGYPCRQKMGACDFLLTTPEFDLASFWLSTSSVKASEGELSLKCTQTSEQTSSYFLTSANQKLTQLSFHEISSTSSTLLCSSGNNRKDFVLLFSDGDQEEAQKYADHLKKELSTRGIKDLSVDLFSDIDSGKTALKSSETLHDRYNYILILANANLANDKFARFLHENILTNGLREANGKEDRVIPVWTCSDCKSLITELICIKGFEYYKFVSDPTSPTAQAYMQCVLYAVQRGRSYS